MHLIIPVASNSMRIALIINYLQNRPAGGPQGVAYNTVEGLRKYHRRLEKEDIHIHIMSHLGTASHSGLSTDEKTGNISYEYFRKIIPTSLFSDLNFYLHLKKQKHAIDLVHSHPIAGAMAGSFLRIPTIFTLHGMYWKERLYDPSIYSRFAYGELNVRRFRYVSRHIKKLIAISPYVINEVQQFLGTTGPDTEVIENPVSDVFFEQEKQEQEGLILYPAIISPLKNQRILIEALCRLKKEQCRFHCILPGPIADYNYYKELQHLIHACNMEKEITIPGPAPLGQMLSLYAEASLLAVTSLQETAPLVISEAMATGTPVLASRISGIPHMVSEDNSGLLINPRDPVEISDKIRMLLDDDSLRNKFGAESRKIAESRWRSDIITNKLLDLYLQQAIRG
jgi:glycosyltransferase involved in cell wall biosynthesis